MNITKKSLTFVNEKDTRKNTYCGKNNFEINEVDIFKYDDEPSVIIKHTKLSLEPKISIYFEFQKLLSEFEI